MTNERTVKFTTKCENCIFSDVTKGIYGEDREQICSFNRLEKFKEQNLAELNDSYYTINTVCKTFRDEEWALQYDDPKEKVLEQIQIQCDVIVLAYNDENLHPNLIRIAKYYARSIIKPKKIIFTIYKDQINNLKETYLCLREILEGKIEYCIMQIFGNKTSYDCVDEAFSRIKSPWYLVVESNQQIERDYISELDYKINTNMERIIYIDSGLHGTIVLSEVHKLFYGNREELLSEKLIEVTKEQDSESMVTMWT